MGQIASMTNGPNIHFGSCRLDLSSTDGEIDLVEFAGKPSYRVVLQTTMALETDLVPDSGVDAGPGAALASFGKDQSGSANYADLFESLVDYDVLLGDYAGDDLE